MYIVVSFDCCVFRTYSILQACFALVQGSHTKSPLHLSYILLHTGLSWNKVYFIELYCHVNRNTQAFPEAKCTSQSCSAMWTETHRPFLKQSVFNGVVLPCERKHTGLSWNKMYFTKFLCIPSIYPVLLPVLMYNVVSVDCGVFRTYSIVHPYFALVQGSSH